LVVNVASVVGSGTYSTWQVSNLMPRFDYNPSTLAAQGLLIEESRTNSLWYSEEFGNIAGWATAGTAPTITTNSTTSPSGTLTADTITFAAADSRIQNEALLSFTAGLSYTITLYAKAVGTSLNKIRLALFDGTQQNSSDFTVSNTAWTRLTVTFVAANNTAVGRMQIRNATDNLANSLYIWGAQLEAGAFPTSYIPTTTTALTRAADVASVNTLSPWFNATEGTLFAEFTRGYTGNFINFSSAAVITNNVIVGTNGIASAYTNGANQQLYNTMTLNSVEQLDYRGKNSQINNKVALAYKTNDTQQFINGLAEITDTSCTVPTSVSQMNIGASYVNNTFMNSWIRRITYYPRRLSQSEGIAITA
jgi:hypothetical protein